MEDDIVFGQKFQKLIPDVLLSRGFQVRFGGPKGLSDEIPSLEVNQNEA
jgi:GR25 family glycosyltransferase involved in LPS biosynthesis